MMQPSGSNTSTPMYTYFSSESGSSLSTPEYKFLDNMTSPLPQTPPLQAPNQLPFLRFLEHPMPRQRLRYESEGLGSIKGAHWTLDNRTKPEVEIVNYSGPVMLLVSCVTASEPFRPHPHQLTSRDTVCSKCNRRIRDRNAACSNGGGRCTLSGTCANYFYLNSVHSETLTEALNGVGLQSVKRNDIQPSIDNQRNHGIDPYNFYTNHPNAPAFQYDLKKFRLCFQAFIHYNNDTNYALEPLVSNLISATELKVKYICKCSATVNGGTELIILGADLPKDVHVRFFEVDNQTEDEVWNVLVKPEEVYRSVAVRLTIPPYHSQQIRPNATIYIRLFRPSDQMESARFKFEYIPNTDNRREENAEMLRNLIDQQTQQQQQQLPNNSIVWNNLDAPSQHQQYQQVQPNPTESIPDTDFVDSLLNILEQFSTQQS